MEGIIYLRVGFLFLLGVFLFACGRQDVQGNEVTIQGFVTSDVGGQGIQTGVVDAQIGIVEINGLGAVSDVQGNYKLSGIPVGRQWTIRVVPSAQTTLTGVGQTTCTVQTPNLISFFVIDTNPPPSPLCIAFNCPPCQGAPTSIPGTFILNITLQ